MCVGLIAEFNPFHFGHQYIIDKAKELTGEPLVCVMSGPFVQRGEPAVADKFVRTKAALLGGADLVIELPTVFAVSAAQTFARGAVATLKCVSGVSALAFGVETDETDLLCRIAEAKRSVGFGERLKAVMGSGVSYPTAVAEALSGIEGAKEALACPNNVLAVEYIEALECSGIKPLPIRRVGSYNDKRLGERFASASALRERLQSGASGLEKYMPADMLASCLSRKPDMALFESLTMYALRRMSLEEIRELPDVTEGLEYSIMRARGLSYPAAIEALKSGRYTYARLKRIFLCALLGITKQIMSDITSVRSCVLGVKAQSKSLLGCLSSNIIGRNSMRTIDNSVAIDALADDVYSLLIGDNGNRYYNTPMIIV